MRTSNQGERPAPSSVESDESREEEANRSGMRRLVVFVTVLALLILAPKATAQTDNDVIDAIKGLLEDGGMGNDLPDILADTNPQYPIGFFDIDEQGRVIVLNLAVIHGWVDQILANSGYALRLDSPFVLGFLLYVTVHELQHNSCCHEDDPPGTIENRCHEVLADINGANAACGLVGALLASLTGPPSEFMSTLLHILCANIQDERNKYNTAWGRSEAAGCKGWSDGRKANGQPGGCECTGGSWDPPKPDPCGDCPDYPDPGSNPQHPYGDGDVIPPCDICDHI